MHPDRSEIEKVLQVIGHDAFPDDQAVRWKVRNIIQRGDFLGVQAEPVPATVGYPQFRFVIRRDATGKFIDHGCYCLSGGVWQLLYTTPGTAQEWKALGFDTAA